MLFPAVLPTIVGPFPFREPMPQETASYLFAIVKIILDKMYKFISFASV